MHWQLRAKAKVLIIIPMHQASFGNISSPKSTFCCRACLISPCMCACRETDRDMVIKGYRVPRGMALMLSPHPMHVSSLNYLHPDKFWPERWVSNTVSEWDPDQAGRWAHDCCYYYDLVVIGPMYKASPMVASNSC